MHRLKLYLAVTVALVAVSCQSALHRSYLKPGEDAGSGLKYYRQYETQQETQQTECDGQPDEQTNGTSQTKPVNG